MLRDPLPEPCLRKTLTTKSGEIVLLTGREDVETANRGFQCDLFELHGLTGTELGYLRSAFVPKAKLAEFYPKPEPMVHYARQLGGWHLPLDTKSPEFLERVSLHTYGKFTNEQEALAELKRRFTKEYKSFVNWNVDKPRVDYISVESDQRGKGLATMLYEQAANFYSERGLAFYASTLQSKEAKDVWQHYNAEGRTKIENTSYMGKPKSRVILLPTQIQPQTNEI